MSKQPSDIEILNRFSPARFGRIVPTSVKKKEDVVRDFRPNKGECLEYDISQTVLRMDAGDTKIAVRDTHATYVPALPVIPKKKKPKVKFPPDKFITEIWMEKQDALQEQFKKEHRRNLKLYKIRDKYRGKDVHDCILSMVGPEWFQELSPNQIRTVDQLGCCILMDVNNKSITNVQENIGRLGLVLRPNHRHIAKALRLCCKNPVEFLLILYQIMNPNRREYSLNDRLLLSAVVHLCMTETLRELHIRIPSPSVNKNVTTKKLKAKKKIKYASPYLEPIVFTPIPPKHTGIYENSRIQYPESPYFSYLETLVIDKNEDEDIFETDLSTLDPEEAELIEDMRQAQLMYDEVWKGERVNLLRPTIRKQCEDVSNFYKSLLKEKPKPLILPPLSSLHDSEDECFCSEALKDTDINSDYEDMSCECEEVCRCKKKSRIFVASKCKACLARERKKYVQRVIKGVAITGENTAVPIVEATILQKTCDCLQKYKDNLTAAKAREILQSQKAKYVIGGVAMTKEGPVYILSCALRKSKKKFVIAPEFTEQVKQNNETNSLKKKSLCGNDVNEDKEIETGKRQLHAECTCNSSKCYERSTNTEPIAKSANTCDCEGEDTKEESPCDCSDCECKQKSKMYTGRRCTKCQEKERQKYVERIITGMKETASRKIMPIIEGTRLLHSCDCVQKYAERIISMEARNKIQSQKAQFVVSGVAFTKDGPVYILSTALLGKKDTCQQIRRCKRKKTPCKKPEPVEEESEEEDLKYSGCKCKQELERFLKHRCTCEECNVLERHAEGITFVMGGVTSNVDDTTVNIVQGVYEPRCDCLEKYQAKIDKLEDYRRRIEAKYNLKSQTLKYSIGGVVNTPNGPVYVITGMRPQVECECAKAARRKEEEERHLRQMAKMPPTGRIKYQIAGVRQSPEGNVFIISQALAVDDCDCDKLYDSYIQAHRACLDVYENFLQQTHEALDEYPPEEITDLSQAGLDIDDVADIEETGWSATVIPTSNALSENSCSNYNLFDKGEVVRAIEPCPGQKRNICSRGEVVSQSRESLFSQCTCQDSEDDETSDSSCAESLVCADTCVQSVPAVVEEKKPVPEEKKKELKRYIIVTEMPSDPKNQLRMLKKALAMMAEDGFPLAKLPDCHKLPHFKLWMHLRCGTIWRQKDIDSYEGRSKTYWNHARICNMSFKLPNIGMSYAKAAKVTWEHANFVKSTIRKNVDMFYRRVGQEVVEKAREFFPISYSYEFPNKTFRNTFFAYLPSKEKDTLAFRIVKPHETREMPRKYSC